MAYTSPKLGTLGDVLMADPNWRAIARAEGIDRRPANDRDNRPDRGFVEQPEERVIAPPVKPAAPTVRRIAPVMLPDNQYRRRVLVQRANATPLTPPALVRPFAERLLGTAPVTQVVATLEELEEMREMELDAAEREAEDNSLEGWSDVINPKPAEEPQRLVKLETRAPMAEAVKPEKRRYRIHSKETKTEAIRRVRAGESRAQVCADMDLSGGIISYWLEQKEIEEAVGRPKAGEKRKPVTPETRQREFAPLELKLAAVARVKQVLAALPAGVSTRGVISAIARETGVSTHGLTLWVKGKGLTKNGPPLPPSENETLLSRPEPPPAPSQVVSVPPPAPPVSAPVTVVQQSAPPVADSLDARLDALVDKQLDQLLERKLEAALKRRLGG